MDWKDIPEIIRRAFVEIKVQVAENFKLSNYITFGGKHYHYHFPEGTDPYKIADLVRRPESENLTVEKSTNKLKEQYPDLLNLPESDRLQIVTDSISASIIEISDISEDIKTSEFAKVELDPP